MRDRSPHVRRRDPVEPPDTGGDSRLGQAFQAGSGPRPCRLWAATWEGLDPPNASLIARICSRVTTSWPRSREVRADRPGTPASGAMVGETRSAAPPENPE